MKSLPRLEEEGKLTILTYEEDGKTTFLRYADMLHIRDTF